MSRADDKRSSRRFEEEVSDDEYDQITSQIKSVVRNRPSSTNGDPSAMAGNKSRMTRHSISSAKDDSQAATEEAIAHFGEETRMNEAKSTVTSSVSSNLKMDSEQLASMKRWLMRPCPANSDTMLCYVERERSGFGFIQQIYRCYLEPSAENPSGRFLMAAKKMSTSKTSYYLVSLDQIPEDRGSETVLGKIRGNAVGSQYLLTDHGLSPEKAIAPSMLRKVCGLMGMLTNCA